MRYSGIPPLRSKFWLTGWSLTIISHFEICIPKSSPENLYFLEKIWKSLHSLKPHPSPCLFRHNCQQCISGRLYTFFRFLFPVWTYVALNACLICRGVFLSWQSSGGRLCNNSVTTFPAVSVRFLLVFIKSGFTSKAGLTTVSCSTRLRFKLLLCPWRVEIL